MAESLKKTENALRRFALAYPETHEDFPWGHSALKVKGKAFVFMGSDKTGLSLSVKLPVSGQQALMLPFCEPTHYGLGKSGWVTASFSAGEKPPMPFLEAWIDESYRAIAPKKLLKSLDEGGTVELVTKKTKKKAKKKKVTKAPVTKKTKTKKAKKTARRSRA